VTAVGIGVFVLGMHRSGTSAITRAINLLGVPMAAEDELMGVNPNNPTGFWEVRRLTKFNNELLEELGGSSLGPPVLAPGWEKGARLERRREQGRVAFEKAHRSSTWVWKDPRNCITFPFWREALGVTPVVVLVHRGPRAIARSLDRRQGLSAPMAFAAWERYMRSALAGARGLPTHVTTLSRLAEAPADWARELSTFLRGHGIDADSEQGLAELGAFVQSSPTTPQDARDEAVEEMSDEQTELAGAIESLIGSHDALVPPELAPETPSATALMAERRRGDLIRLQMKERLRSQRRQRRRTKRALAEAREASERRGRTRTLVARVRSGGRRRRRARTHRQPETGGLPDFLIIGGQKCGSTSLFRNLAESPEVLPARKEIHFFDVQFDRGVDWYRTHFRFEGADGAAGGRTITGEASPYYLFHPLAPQRARAVAPDARLIALLRNPVRRAVSHYYHEVGNGVEELPLAQALEREPERLAGEAERIAAEPGYSSFAHRHFSYQARGDYLVQLEAWLAAFPREQLLVLNSERLFGAPDEEMRRVYDFLDLAGEPRGFDAWNQRGYPAPEPEVVDRLTAHFAKRNERLYEFLGEDFGW
jgi:hypothetical protein